MNADDVIDSYVRDVARRLPPRQRDDVAFELRALLDEDLRARVAAEGRAPDADLALALVRSLGRPELRRGRAAHERRGPGVAGPARAAVRRQEPDPEPPA